MLPGGSGAVLTQISFSSSTELVTHQAAAGVFNSEKGNFSVREKKKIV